MPSLGNLYATAKRLRRHHGPTMAAWWAAEHGSSHPAGSAERDFWFSVHEILRKADRAKKKVRHHPGSVRAAMKSWQKFGHIKRNPPKLDKVVVRYAERVYRDLIAAIESGKLKPKVIQEPNLKMISVKGEWLYKLQMEYRPIDLTVSTSSIGGRTFVPDERKKPVEMVVKGGHDGLPYKSMFIHEFAHYLQAKHGIMLGTEHHKSVADYLDASEERDAYFIQFLTEFLNPLLLRIAKKADPAVDFDYWFGNQKKITQRVKLYFSRSGLWQEMKPQTRKHHIDRLTAYIEHIRGS
jgi:hypothetical protein